MTGIIITLKQAWLSWYIEPAPESRALKQRRRHVFVSSFMTAMSVFFVQAGVRALALPFLVFLIYALWAHWTYWRGKWAAEGWHGGKLITPYSGVSGDSRGSDEGASDA